MSLAFQKDGKWWVHDYVEVLDLEERQELEPALLALHDVHIDLASKGWTELKLTFGGRYDRDLVVTGTRPEAESETADRLRNERIGEEQFKKREQAEYERLKKIYG